MNFEIRPATLDDAIFMVPLVNAAGEGLPFYLWTTMAPPGEDPWEIGLRRVRSDDAGISWRKAWIAEASGGPAGVLIVYQQPDAAEEGDHADMPPLFRPLVELEAEAPGTGYIQILSVPEAMRGRGVGTALLRYAERWRGSKGMSLIVSDANQIARRLYERNGYSEAGRRRIVKNGWETPGTDWILMRKP